MAPFSTTALPPASPLFRSRQAELARLKQICHEDVTAYTVIYGGHQNGKTSLLLQLEAALEGIVSVCRIDFQLIKGAPAPRAFGFLAEKIARVLPLAPDHRTVADAPALMDFLVQALSQRTITRLVLLLDELGALPVETRQAVANALRSFFHARLVQPALTRVQIIFSGGIELYDLVVSEASALHNICEEIYLADLPLAEAIRLIADGLQSLGTVPEAAHRIGEQVYTQVGGHPYLTQRIGTLLTSAMQRGEAVDPAQVTHMAHQIGQRGDPLLRQIRNDLRKHQLEDAARRLLSAPPRFTRMNDEMVRLELIGLAKPGATHWAPRNPLLATVFRELLDQKEQHKQPEEKLPPSQSQGNTVVSTKTRPPTPLSELVPDLPDLLRDVDVNTSVRRRPPQRLFDLRDVNVNTSIPRRPSPPRQPLFDLSDLSDDDLFNQQAPRERSTSRPERVYHPSPRLLGFLAMLSFLILIFTFSREPSNREPSIIANGWSSLATVKESVTIKVQGISLELTEIRQGEFLMGSWDDDAVADIYEKPQQTLNLPTYWIGKTEVTNAQFRPFVEGDGYTNRDYWTEAGWAWRQENNITQPQYWNDEQWNGDTYPVVGISWFEALAYVRWLSAQTGHEFRLPTEAEWEKAARGPEGRIWPWGNEWQDGLANSEEAGLERTTPVRQYPDGAGPYGTLDMAGNVWEWCATEWRKDYPYQMEDEWAEAYLERDVGRVIRGGSWYQAAKYVRGAYRGLYHPRDRLNKIGLRVASHSPLPGSVS